MKKILLLTKINPIEVLDVMMRLYRGDCADSHTLFFSPQYTAMLASETTGGPFQEVFYSGLRVWETQKEKVLVSHPEFDIVVVVGTVDKSTISWYDAVISLNNPDINDYVMDEDFNTTHIKYLTTEDGEIKFNTLEEAEYFIKHVQTVSRKEKKDGVQ